MSAPVPMIAPHVNLTPIQTGKPPAGGGTWQQLAALANYCNGRGGTLVPAYYPGNTITAGTNGTYRYMVYPVRAALTRMWIVRAHSVSTAPSTITLTAPAAGSYTTAASVGNNISTTGAIVLFETIGTRASVAQEISLNIAAADQNAVIDSIACFEVPRSALGLGVSPTEYGCDADTVRGGSAIYEPTPTGPGTYDYRSIHGVAESMRFNRVQNTPRMHPNRMLFCWAVPDNNPWTTSSGSHVAITQLPVPYLTKRSRVKAKAPSSTVRFHYYARVNAGAGQLGYRKGDTENISGASYQNIGVVTTTFGWADDFWSTTQAMEDLDQPDGRYDDSGTPKWSEFQFAGKVLTAANLDIASICVYDEDT